MPRVNPEILAWARETAGFSLEEAVRAIGLNEAWGRTGAERLAALEQGEEEPSRPLLLKMADKYRRSLLTFYLDKVPRKGDRGQDFRTAPGAGSPAYNATIDALIRDVNTRHSLVKSLLEDEDAPSLPFVASADMKQDAEALATAIRETLRLNIQEFRRQDTVEAAFKYLRSRIEGVGIFVLMIGNLGSHHTNISPEMFRGFAIADPVAPFIVINDQDARTAWSFTALHEVAHILLGATGISGSSLESRIESLCNDVAGRILLLDDEIQILASVGDAPINEAIERISVFSEERKLSRSMVAYSLLRASIVSVTQWHELKNRFYQEWLDLKARKRDKQRAAGGGPSYYVVKRDRLGSALLNLVERSLSEGAITYTKAGKVLGVKPGNVVPLLRDNPQRGGW